MPLCDTCLNQQYERLSQLNTSFMQLDNLCETEVPKFKKGIEKWDVLILAAGDVVEVVQLVRDRREAHAQLGLAARSYCTAASPLDAHSAPGTRPSIASEYKFPVEVPLTRELRDTWGGAREYRAGAHSGVDIYVPEGTEVFAVTGGTVIALSSNPDVGGTMAFVKDNEGNTWGYMHLKEYATGIKRGATIDTGALLGQSGKTGIKRSAPHLHVQVKGPNGALWNPYAKLKDSRDEGFGKSKSAGNVCK
jgi:peptidoglycan LD-endopeptidase LytH